MNLVKHFAPSLLRKASRRTSPIDERSAVWTSPSHSASGYDNPLILETVAGATARVLSGEALGERDGVNFSTVPYNWAVLSGLFFAGLEAKDLRVVDFGGALGSTYLQLRAHLEILDEAMWVVVEQEGFVEKGNDLHKADPRITFRENYQEALLEFSPTVVLMGSSLQYVENAHEIIRQTQQSAARHLIIDKSPFQSGPSDLEAMQWVPAEIYPASYPLWLFSETTFEEELVGWKVLSEFETVGPPAFTRQGTPLKWKGMHYVRSRV